MYVVFSTGCTIKGEHDAFSMRARTRAMELVCEGFTCPEHTSSVVAVVLVVSKHPVPRRLIDRTDKRLEMVKVKLKAERVVDGLVGINLSKWDNNS